jgi:hypothetical protein
VGEAGISIASRVINFDSLRLARLLPRANGDGGGEEMVVAPRRVLPLRLIVSASQ